MKKSIALLTVFLLLFTFTACTDNDNVTPPVITNSPNVPVPSNLPSLSPTLPNITPLPSPNLNGKASDFTGNSMIAFEESPALAASAEVDDSIVIAETDIYDKTANRINNIEIAADSINNIEINPGEIFSFNDVVGKRTSAKGYKTAIIFKNLKHVMANGGGVCQLSTTIFQAAKNAGLKIIERHDHQLPVAYAEKGNDAAVYYGEKDFKFENTSGKKIKVSTYVKDEKVISAISCLQE